MTGSPAAIPPSARRTASPRAGLLTAFPGALGRPGEALIPIGLPALALIVVRCGSYTLAHRRSPCVRRAALAMFATPVSAQDMLDRRCQDLITAETTRLARRAPALRPDQLSEVTEALRRVTSQLVLAHTNAVSDTQLAALFDLAGTP